MSAERTVSGPLAQLPNALTLARLVVIPVYAALILECTHGYSWPAAVLFGAAGATDQIDGFLARRWHVESAFGKFAQTSWQTGSARSTSHVVLLWHPDDVRGRRSRTPTRRASDAPRNPSI